MAELRAARGDALRLRRGRRPAERRQVDARERARRARRSRSSPTSRRPPGARSAASPTASTRARLAARARRPAGRAAARATRSPSACSAASSGSSATPTPRCSCSTAPSAAAAATASSPARSRVAGVPVVAAVNKTDLLDRARTAAALFDGRGAGGRGRRVPRGRSRLGADGRRACAELREELVDLLPEGPFYYPEGEHSRPAAGGARSPS